ncbi:MAG TPA: hypothetical protein VN894_04405 [Polyangiaceae bacterium]|nr:hypothetical protein [Polyangiaceae bacterium]
MRTGLVALAVLVLVGAAAPAPARAQGNLRAAPTGGRSVLMGGTGVALGRDAAAPFLNPATVARIDDSGIAFSSNFYTFTATQFTGFHQPGPVDTAQFGALNLPQPDLSRGRIDGLPATLCLFLKVGHHTAPITADENRAGRQKLAACLGNVERQLFDATGQGYTGDSGGLHTTQAISIARRWNRLYVGPSYSVYVTDRLAIGASLDAISTTASSTWSVDTLSYGGPGPAAASGFDTSYNAYSIDLGALFGVIYHIDSHQIVGLSVSTPTLHVVGGYKSTATIGELAPNPAVSLTTASGGFISAPPVRVSAGLGAELGRLRIEVDATLWVPVQPFARAEAQVSQTTLVGNVSTLRSYNELVDVDTQPIVDTSFGVEWFLSPSWSLLGGASTDWSALDALPSSPMPSTVAETRLHRLTTSFGVGMHGVATELLLGTELSYGWGRSIAVDPYVDPPRLALVDEHAFGVMLVVAGRTSLAVVRETLSRVIGAQP